MERLLLAHESESNHRISSNLSDYGINCVSFEPSENVYDLSEEFLNVDAGFVYPGRLIEGGVIESLLSINWVNSLEDVMMTRNKAQCIAELSKNGVPVPETHLVSNPASDSKIEAAFKEVGTPAILKPNSTTRGRGVVKVDDKDSLAGVSDYFRVIHDSSLVFDRTFLVQEFIDDSDDYRVMVIDGEYVGAVQRSSEGWKHNVHRGAKPRGVTPREEIIELAEKTANILDIDFCGVDVLDGDTTVVNEVNGRPTVDTRDKYEENFYDVFARVVQKHV